MPRLTHSAPKYRHHRGSGQAVVSIAGRDHYLGPWKSKGSKVEYDRLIGEWLAAGRPSQLLTPHDAGLTVTEFLAAYWRYAQTHYVKNGQPTSELDGMRIALRFLKQHYGHTEVSKFGPLGLKALQQRMIESGHTRGYINQNISRIRRLFKWGTSEQLIDVSIYQALATVEGLRVGKSAAKEGQGVRAVADATVDLTLDHVPPVVADMIRLQRLTGARPAEICILRPCDVNTEGETWLYRPSSHKTMHHGQERCIFIGPRGQNVLRPYLLRDKESFCFVPSESEKQRRQRMHEARTTPLEYGNAPGTNKKRRPLWKAGERYDVDSYRRAITRGCELAFGMPPELRKLDPKLGADEVLRRRKAAAEWRAANVWSPNQLRHTAATKIRSRFGADASQVVLGHSDLDTTLVYAEADMAKAAAVMREVG